MILGRLNIKPSMTAARAGISFNVLWAPSVESGEIQGGSGKLGEFSWFVPLEA